MSIDRRLSLLTEFDTREAQMVVLFENLESYMIRETCNKIQRDMTLIKAEKVGFIEKEVSVSLTNVLLS